MEQRRPWPVSDSTAISAKQAKSIGSTSKGSWLGKVPEKDVLTDDVDEDGTETAAAAAAAAIGVALELLTPLLETEVGETL